MIPVLIEPTCLSYDLNMSDIREETNDFKDFLKELHLLFGDLERSNLGIAMSKEMFFLLQGSVPAFTYSNPSLARIARETFGPKLRKYSKFVYKIGDGIAVSYDSAGIVNNLSLLNSEIYRLWQDLLGLVYHRKLAPCILRSSSKTIFNEKTLKVFFDKRNSIIFHITDNIEELNKAEGVELFRYSLSLSQLKIDNKHIPCSGTGTHDSMWNKKIRSLEDVPAMERGILLQLINTGIVKRITFLDFNRKLPALGSPKILINNVETKAMSDLLWCTLQGKGVKNNCQEICVEIEKGFGAPLKELFTEELCVQSLEELTAAVAASKQNELE